MPAKKAAIPIEISIVNSDDGNGGVLNAVRGTKVFIPKLVLTRLRPLYELGYENQFGTPRGINQF